ncbi:MAG: hypothetical protein KME16_22430 [Scytolyngbya sp. HA4215-MV1]|jgi:hypothetical protein|nr:hypothetical protein [Scytolyngbya sp. HA4215-MV1]
MGKRHPESQDSRRTISPTDFGVVLMMLLSIALLKPVRLTDFQAQFQSSRSVSSAPSSAFDPFRSAVNQAMQAAILTQSAHTEEDWATVVATWQAAIVRMQAVPPSSRHHTLAQQKVIEYRRNLAYAQQKMSTSPHLAKVGTQVSDRSLDATPTKTPLALNLRPSINDDKADNDYKTGILGHPDADSDPFLATPATLQPRNWMMLAKTQDQTYYIDAESLSRNLPYVEFWQRIYSLQSNHSAELQDQRILANCQTFQFQLKETIHYQKGKIHRTTPKTLETPPNGGAQMRLINSVCAQ